MNPDEYRVRMEIDAWKARVLSWLMKIFGRGYEKTQ